MLGLGASATSTASANIYKELSELANYADLDIHFDFSLLTGANASEVTAATNLGAGGATYNIDSNTTDPVLDTATLSRNSVLFNTTDDILNMANDYTTSGKAMTFFAVFQKADTSNDLAFSGASNANSIKLEEDVATLQLGSSSTFTIDHGTTGSSTVDYEIIPDTPTLFVFLRNGGGTVSMLADNNIAIAVKGSGSARAGATFNLQHIGGTAEGDIADYAGNICEVGLYDTNLSGANIEILMKELCTKWGINRRA